DIVATPHFYIDDNDVDEFLATREHCFKKLGEVLDDKMPRIYVGAEVYYFNGISLYEGLDKLTVNNSEYLLLEMPFMQWNERILKEVENIIYDRKLKVIIAHIERYIDFQKGTSNINSLLSLNPIIQMNGEYINSIFTRKKALSFIKNDVVQLIGSDCHNMTNRMPNLDKAYKHIEKKLGIDVVNKINKLGKEILNIC
ncbi:MAG: CpsB/CapC family capsule biosynthesis tyrosine phosphatase, partial [Lachnospirales bacterium]